MFIEEEDERGHNRQDEPDAIRNLTKKKAYTHLSITLIVPDSTSRAISRRYLCGVVREEFFSVNRTLLLEFKAHLRPSDLIRASDQCLPVVLTKLNNFLVETGRLPLGFQGTAYPDESWVYRVVRYVDPSNVLRCFKKGIENAPNPGGMLARV